MNSLSNNADALYFSGERLRGDDFSHAEEAAWYAAEVGAYQDLGYSDSSAGDDYPYHLLNSKLGYSKISMRPESKILGIGSAHGAEFLPIAHLAKSFHVVESDQRYWRNELFGKPAKYTAPSPSGFLLDASNFDLVTCFGVLHHVCKVSAFVAEVNRVLRPGAYMLVREPIISMGDWRKPRSGLTQNERGIPLRIMRSICESSGFEILSEQLVGHKGIEIIWKLFRSTPWKSKTGIVVDQLVGSMYRDVRYHRRSAFEKLTPTSAFWVLRKK